MGNKSINQQIEVTKESAEAKDLTLKEVSQFFNLLEAFFNVFALH